MACSKPQPVKWQKFIKINEQTGETYETKRPIFVSWNEITPEKWEDYDYLPCGKCENCQIDKSNQWATRCLLEAQKWPKNAFLTLTYDDTHLPKDKSLLKADLQKFWKRLRKSLKDEKIRYYACGEYGSTTMRPHYHAAVFNYWPDDCIFYKPNSEKQPLWTSPKLEKIWGKGFVIIGALTYESAAYIARYVQKKGYGIDNKFYEQAGLSKEFILSSRRPGIGANCDIEKIKRNSGIIMPGGKIKAIPTFIKNKWRENNREEYNEISEKVNKAVKNEIKKMLNKTDLNYFQYARTQEETKRARAKRLDKRTNI